MGIPRSPELVLRILAAFSHEPDALHWTRSWAESVWGAVELESSVFRFEETDYYTATMGKNLVKRFWAFSRLVDPQELAIDKLSTNDCEAEFTHQSEHRVERPLNLDPGYISSGKLVLSSTKDHAHRIYLSNGIYAEVTLSYQFGGWRAHDWTFPDYRRDDYHAFFSLCRAYLRRELKRNH